MMCFNSLILFIILMLSFCLCTKRARSEIEPYVLTRKRAKTIVGLIQESIVQGNTEEFVKLMSANSLNGLYSVFYLGSQNADNLLMLAIKNHQAKIVQRMMGMHRFLAVLDFHHFQEAMIGPADVLYGLINAWKYDEITYPFDKGPLYYDRKMRNLYEQAVSRPLHLKLIAKKFSPNFKNLSCCARHTQGACKQVLYCYLKFHALFVSNIEFEALTLCAVQSPLNGFIDTWNNLFLIKDTNEQLQARPVVMRKLVKIIQYLDARDLNGLTELIAELENKYEEMVQLRCMAIEAAVNRNLYSILEAIIKPRHDMLPGMMLSLPSIRLYNIFAKALSDNQIEPVRLALNKMSIHISNDTLGKLLLIIFNDWIEEGNFALILKSSTYVKSQKLFDVTKKHDLYLRLAERVNIGDWRYLMVFQELHSDKLIAANAAWDYIFSARPSDTFLDFAFRSSPDN